MFQKKLFAIYFVQKTPVKHFSLKRKPKSALLRAELIQKANDVAKINAKKAPAPAIPLRTRAMPRKLNDNSKFKFVHIHVHL